MQTGKFFNVRVYAILINSKRELLVSDEFHYNTNMRKFPGGGLQFGEGIVDCLHRELKEELDVEVSNIKHFHTTEVFSQSAFNPNHQVIGVYYLVEPPESILDKYPVNASMPTSDDAEIFKWISIDLLTENDFTFPVDKAAFKKLATTFRFK
jgi:8-oxo-dGTP diphosphatase